jgi:hypothetical protein
VAGRKARVTPSAASVFSMDLFAFLSRPVSARMQSTFSRMAMAVQRA